ncbi:DUF262 domain-containing HNH endonuclease family protein [Aneurinibacillus sp. Ricciae_BoGa-3]|uniref:DUF262 domain-containing protein n=1 Tax=Aneurinibacillus sp. Ricciae_BoGa-3 TaxID=3022697 RepID=UPI002341C869|nr:DUF262 domain-containing HNH endonuclease family protein [Aneurinibacillus sp. Ricciae_BoGa-3]WCK54751.1 DUF262 domain-containing HNH endonuclease family protein [Aneurinibacillus sp. Ricciae_BoGa-3]
MQKTIEMFFTGKRFGIPAYQRNYAWEVSNIDDLFDDILEAMELQSGHYIGTFILSKKEDANYFDIVDGQQRLTTLTMILNATIQSLSSMKDKIINEDRFICSNGQWILSLLGENKGFFRDMLQDKNPISVNNSQKLLQTAYKHIQSRVQAIKNQGMENAFLNCIRNLEVMEFVEDNAGKAIRIFQTVNDRGKPLAIIDKVKSLLIYYSNRLLSGKLDDFINHSFGEIYQNYTEIKEIGSETNIALISQKNFTEDTLLRYQYIAYKYKGGQGQFDFNATSRFVLDIFLKNILKDKKHNPSELEAFLVDYVSDLQMFFHHMLSVMKKVMTDKKYFKLFSVLGMSTFLYPLVVRLEERQLLDSLLPGGFNTFLDLIEIADLRVYKVRGTDPVKDTALLAHDAKVISADEIEERLLSFIQRFMGNAEFKSRLEGQIYGNVGLKHIFIEYNEHLLIAQQKAGYTMNDLAAFNTDNKLRFSVEHVFSQKHTLSFPNRGFANEEEYVTKIHQIGNLTAIEQPLNTSGTNSTPERKVQNGVYVKSRYEMTNQLGAYIQNKGYTFTKQDVDKRTENLVEFCLKRWAI